MEQRDISIICQVCYKEFMAKSLDGNVDFSQLKKHVQELIRVVGEISDLKIVPFENKSRGLEVQSPRPMGRSNLQDSKVIGNPCSTCGTPYIQGKNGAYCKPCYLKWKAGQK